MRGSGRPAAASSLRTRARFLVAFGFASLVLLGVFEALQQDEVIAAEQNVIAVRAVAADNQALATALSTQQPALRNYLAQLANPNHTTAVLSERDDLLNDYLAASGDSAAAVQRLTADAKHAGIDASATARAAIAWQAWAAQRRAAAEPGGAVANGVAATPSDSEGESLYATFVGTDRIFADSLARQEAAASRRADNLSANHARVFFTALALEAIALLLLGLALLRQVLRPLAQLTAAAGDLAAGRPVAVPHQERSDEVGSLARALTLWQRSSTEMFRVFQRSPIGIARLNADGRVLEANPSFEHMIGVAPGGLDGRDVAALVAPAERRTILGHVAQLTAPNPADSQILEARLLRADATEFWADITLAAVPTEDGARYLLAMVEDVDVRKRQELELRHRAAHDPLTGLPNRSLFDDRLDQALRTARRAREPLAVVLVDLDRFKPVNDELGHHAGDEVLRQVAHRLRVALRESDTVARLGGDEFAIILPEQDARGALRTVAKLERAMAPHFHVAGHDRNVGMSAGIAVFPDDGGAPTVLVAAADRAMYRAKAGRDSVSPSSR